MPHEHSKPLREPTQAERIDQLRQKLNELSGGTMLDGASPQCPPDLREKFLQSVLRYETAEETSIQSLLAQRGFEFPPPEALSDGELTPTLKHLIEALAHVRVFLDYTDHLSDRELYGYLWHEALPVEDVLFPDDPSFACHLDPIGGGSHDEVRTFLRYYADEAYRARWAKEFPEDPMPPHEEPPYDRDRYLPEPF